MNSSLLLQLNHCEFMPEMYYSFHVPNADMKGSESTSPSSIDTFRRTLLLKDARSASLYRQYHLYDNIIGIPSLKEIKIKGSLLSDTSFTFLSNIEIVGEAHLRPFFYLEDCCIDQLYIADETHLHPRRFYSHFHFKSCSFRYPIQSTHMTNLLFEKCNPMEYSDLNIVNIIHVLHHSLSTTHHYDQHYIYHKQSAIIHIIMAFYKHIRYNYQFKPQLCFRNQQYLLLFKRDHQEEEYWIDYCISPGIMRPLSAKGISITSFLHQSNGKKLIVIPNGIYYIDQPVDISCHMIGIGFPIIHFIQHGQIICKHSFIMIEGLDIRNHTEQVLFTLEKDSITLMNIKIQNEPKSKHGYAMISILSSFNYLNNIRLLNQTKHYQHGIVLMGNSNILLSISSDAFQKCNFFNFGVHNHFIYINSEVTHNLAVQSTQKLIVLGSSFFCYSVLNETYLLSHDSVLKNTYILYMDDYQSIHESKLLYFPYFINYEKKKIISDLLSVKQITYEPHSQLFLWKLF